MTLETFFEKFEILAETADGLTRTREIILELAVSGRLGGRADAWQSRPLKSLTTKIGSGATPSGGRQSYFDHGTPLIRSMNVHFRGFAPEGLVFLNDQQAKQLSGVEVFANDVLFNITGASIGRVTIAPPEMAGARVNQHVTIIRTTSELLPAFLVLFLSSPSVQRMIDETQVGATRQALTKGKIEQFNIPLPPLAEQKRIVAKVDELMVLCDRLEAQHKEREEKHAALARAAVARFEKAPTAQNIEYLLHVDYPVSVEDLRGAILTQAILGKIVLQDPVDDLAEHTAKLIHEEKSELVAKGLLRKTERTAAVLPATDLELPSSWKLVPLDEVSISVTDGDHLPPPKTESGVPFLVIGNVRWGGIDFTGCRHVSTAYYEKLDWIRKPRQGDVLYTLVGSFGIPVVVREPKAFCVQRHIGIIRPSKHVNVEYMALVLASEFAYRQAASIATGIAQKTVPLVGLRRLAVPLPPLAEQSRIVAKVNELMALVGQLEAQLLVADKVGTKLMEAVVAELAA